MAIEPEAHIVFFEGGKKVLDERHPLFDDLTTVCEPTVLNKMVMGRWQRVAIVFSYGQARECFQHMTGKDCFAYCIDESKMKIEMCVSMAQADEFYRGDKR